MERVMVHSNYTMLLCLPSSLTTTTILIVMEQVDLSNGLRDYDVVFSLPLYDYAKRDYHYRSAFYLAAISMVTGWEFDSQVGW